MSLIFVCLSLLIYIISVELLLRNSKVQTALFKCLVLFLIIGIITIPMAMDEIKLFVLFTFYSGFFLCWFLLRSHLESSIFLRILVLLHSQSLEKEILLERYHEDFGIAFRIDELLRGNLLQRDTAGEITCTNKGVRIQQIFSFLRGGELP